MSIWDFAQIKSTLAADDYVSLGEGYTPIDHIDIDGQLIDLKREDDNPSGSYKDRGSAYKITELKQQGITRAVISSSGNAAISFFMYGSAAGIAIEALVSPNVNPVKLAKLQKLAENSNHKIHIDARARQLAAKLVAETGAYNLKASIDPHMPIGYRTIGFEIMNENYTDIFVATSSGTALVGISQALPNAKLHACQTSSIHLIAEVYDQNLPEEESQTLADAITDKLALRKEQIMNMPNVTGWVLSNKQIENAFKQANAQLDRPISYTSALALAGFVKAKQQGKVGAKPLIIVSGT